jgi:hypothetical protein
MLAQIEGTARKTHDEALREQMKQLRHSESYAGRVVLRSLTPSTLAAVSVRSKLSTRTPPQDVPTRPSTVGPEPNVGRRVAKSKLQSTPRHDCLAATYEERPQRLEAIDGEPTEHYLWESGSTNLCCCRIASGEIRPE